MSLLFSFKKNRDMLNRSVMQPLRCGSVAPPPDNYVSPYSGGRTQYLLPEGHIQRNNTYGTVGGLLNTNIQAVGPFRTTFRVAQASLNDKFYNGYYSFGPQPHYNPIQRKNWKGVPQLIGDPTQMLQS